MKLFGAHLHIIDARFPLVANQGYLPPVFGCDDYLERMSTHELIGGAVVSASFQGFDQDYLRDALARLGPSFVGVTQLPAGVSDAELIALDRAGVRALRFNLKRGDAITPSDLDRLARRVDEVVGWPVELYIDAAGLEEYRVTLLALPAVSIDHLGLSETGLDTLVRLAGEGIRVKASGFGRVDFDVSDALRALHAANPDALMFGSDLPSTRAPRAYRDDDIALIEEALGEQAASRVLFRNALAFYRAAG